MERYDIRVNVWGGVTGPQYEWETVKAEDGDFVLYADAQAQLEAVRRERDELQAHEELTHAELGVILGTDTSLLDGAKRLQTALDAERTRREQVEMANYAKDGQIETLQKHVEMHKEIANNQTWWTKKYKTELATLKALVGEEGGDGE